LASTVRDAWLVVQIVAALPAGRLPIVPSPDAILLLVAGGPGKHSAVIPNMAVGLAVSRKIDG
jgi:hypothetical protein